ncbi:hypothetical protein SUGI_0087320 [Cryptomeria japonica]|uniref:aldehyde oxidase GLOX n=1 Tax=Cryptomeria japonica TaxID=3369 RepID=UPI002408BC7C|nr:aldehyde oxidase GLOX [Cryptomeria japonica]GLJ08367.1 hypothetical protein SUGI_0087320 [Cryptomeria japonica]
MWGSGELISKLAVLLLLASCLKLSLAQQRGKWVPLLNNSGVSAMHTILTHTNKVIIFDQTTAGPSEIMRTDPPCNENPESEAEDCTAHSVEYDIATDSVRPLHILTDTWCSSGSFDSDGLLVQTGGWSTGEKVIRNFKPCDDSICDWVETSTTLARKRWYSSDQILPDGRIIIVGGRATFSYEFVPKQPGESVFRLPFLADTNTVGEQNNLYPFTHLSSDGNLFIFANKDSILLDYNKNNVVRTFPTMPGGGARNYPSTGSSVMLPLDPANDFQTVEILVCGGAPDGAFKQADQDEIFVDALKSCGRIVITSENPEWRMEDMPGPRVMGDMLILPTGEILIINGAKEGTAGFQSARKPALSPLLYRPEEDLGNRFTVLAASKIPRMYHSTANVLPDGRVFVGGSNSNGRYRFSGVFFPTELRLEAYIPYYLDSSFNSMRPNITLLSTREIKYGTQFTLVFSVATLQNIEFNAYAPPFTTHSWSMNQRFLWLDAASKVADQATDGSYSVKVTAPPSAVAAPSGYYLFRVVNGGIPSSAEWIRFIQ